MTPNEEMEVNHAEVLANYFKANGKNLVDVVRHPYFQKMSLSAQKEFLLKHKDELKANPNILSYLSKNLSSLLSGLFVTSLTVQGLTRNLNNPDLPGILNGAAAILGAGLHVSNAVSSYISDKKALDNLRSAEASTLARRIVEASDVPGLRMSGAAGALNLLQKSYTSDSFQRKLSGQD